MKDQHPEPKSATGSRSRKASRNPEFAAIILKSRQRAGLSQPELARLAGVSPKTIAQLETRGVARWDAIARIARTLGESPDAWLRVTGHKVSQSRVEDILRGRSVLTTFPFERMDPATYYTRVAERTRVHGSALMCTCILSPLPLYTEDLRRQMEEVLSAGLHFALICPFPVADQYIASTKPRLNQYYTNTYSWVCNLAKRMRSIVAIAQNRIHVFAPKLSTGGALLVNTPIRANELRPSLTKYSQKGQIPARYEFGAYIRFIDSRPDQWIEIYDGESEMNERAEEAYGPWHDYCADIIHAWTLVGSESHYDLKKLEQGAWRLMPIGN